MFSYGIIVGRVSLACCVKLYASSVFCENQTQVSAHTLPPPPPTTLKKTLSESIHGKDMGQGISKEK